MDKPAVHSGEEYMSEEAILAYAPEITAPVIAFREIPSTNTYAKKLAGEGAVHGTLIVADSQSSGRGRQGHIFHSPGHTGLYFSLILRPKPDDPVFRLTPAAGVAAVEAIREVIGIQTGIKWVNDLFRDHKKVGGILTEAITDHTSGTITAVVVGIGINCRPMEFPAEIRDTAGTLGQEHISLCQLAAVLRRILLHYASRLNDPAFMDLYRRYSVILGREILFTRDGETYTGTACTINDEGHLGIQKPDGRIEFLQSGEISVRSW